MESRHTPVKSLLSSSRQVGFVMSLKYGLAMLRARWYLRKATVLGTKARVWGRPFVNNQGVMKFGERIRLDSTIATLELVSAPGGVLEIGSSTFINYGCSIAANLLVSIGADCSIGTYVNIMDNNFHRLEPDHRYEMPESQPVILEDNVWLGTRVIVLPGVTIGTGSVVGAGSVVTRDIPPYALAVGCPAKIVRKLNVDAD
jgi:maltose O-acetyltransferase